MTCPPCCTQGSVCSPPGSSCCSWPEWAPQWRGTEGLCLCRCFPCVRGVFGTSDMHWRAATGSPVPSQAGSIAGNLHSLGAVSLAWLPRHAQQLWRSSLGVRACCSVPMAAAARWGLDHSRTGDREGTRRCWAQGEGERRGCMAAPWRCSPRCCTVGAARCGFIVVGVSAGHGDTVVIVPQHRRTGTQPPPHLRPHSPRPPQAPCRAVGAPPQRG